MGFKVKCVPVLDKMPCICCSCDLKVGTLVLGWLGLISEVCSFLRCAVFLAMFGESEKKLPQDIPQGAIEAVIVQLVLSAIGILLVSLLLYGAHNEKPHFMLPFIITNMIGLVIMAVAVPIISIILLICSVVAGFFFLLFGGLLVVLAYFFWVVIYSYYRKLEEQRYPFQGASLGYIVKEEQLTMQTGHTKPDLRVEPSK